MTRSTQENTLALLILAVATVFGYYWVWGLLFVFWSAQGLRTGSVFLISPISRAGAPLLFWCVTLMWLFFGIWELVFDLAWRFGINAIFGIDLYSGL